MPPDELELEHEQERKDQAHERELLDEMTPRALVAFEDYWAQGPMRSSRRLLMQYGAQAESRDALLEAGREAEAKQVGDPPTLRRATLARWSTEYQWMEVIRIRIIQQTRAFRQQALEREVKHAERILLGMEAETLKYLKEKGDPEKGKFMIVDAKDFVEVQKLFFQVLGRPLRTRSDVGVAEDTGPQTIILQIDEPDPETDFADEEKDD